MPINALTSLSVPRRAPINAFPDDQSNPPARPQTHWSNRTLLRFCFLPLIQHQDRIFPLSLFRHDYVSSLSIVFRYLEGTS